MQDYQAVTLGNLANGGAEEVFQRELRKVLENIADVNADWKVVRSISVVVKFMANEKRDGAALAVQSSTKLAPPIVASSVLHLGRDAEGKRVAIQNCAKQEDIFSVMPGPISTAFERQGGV